MRTVRSWRNLAVVIATATLIAACGGADEGVAGFDPVAEATDEALTTAEAALETAEAAAATAEEALATAEAAEQTAEEAVAAAEEAAAEEGTSEETHAEETHAEETVSAHEAPHWTYEGSTGPESWAGLDAAFSACEAGTEQSPIDVNPAGTWALGLDDVTIHWSPVELEMINNGHTIQANVPPGNTTVFDGTTYDLLQFHFHKPSEHTVTHEAFPMELHFVHADSHGNLAVLGALLEAGPANEAFDVLWAAQPADGESIVIGEPFDMTTLLPADLSRYRYSGSLTTPPCSEGVNWNVLASPVFLSELQIEEFVYDGNARPVQAINDRQVLIDNG